MASARPRTFDRRNGGGHVRYPRRLPRARRQIPCIANRYARRTPRSRRVNGTSGRHARQQCLPLPARSGFPRPLMSSSLALLTLPQALHVSNGPPDPFLNAFIAGRQCCRILLEKEPPLLHHLDPCRGGFCRYLDFETTELQLRRGHQRRGVVRWSPPQCGLMSAGLGPATVKINRAFGHGSAPTGPPWPASGRMWCCIAGLHVTLRYPGARFRRVARYRPSRSVCVARRRCALRFRHPGWPGAEPNRGGGVRPRPPRPPA